MNTTKLFGLLLAGWCLTACIQQEQPLAAMIDAALDNATQQSLRMATDRQLLDNNDLLPRSFENGKLITSNSRWWCSGFFAGVLWYLYENNPQTQLLEQAQRYTARVQAEQYNTGTHDLGFMLYCSFGNGLRLTGNTDYRDVLLNGAKSLSQRFNPTIGLIKSWDNNKWQYPVIIDNMMNLELLFWAARESGDTTFRNICVSHADRTTREHLRPDFSSYHVVGYDTVSAEAYTKQTHQGYADMSAWSRGQAWGLYGYTVMYRETKDARYLDVAKNIANFILTHPNMPDDGIPFWDFDAPYIPDEPRDASAGAIICSALIELSRYVDHSLAKQYLRVAEKQLRTLASSAYTAQPNENGNFILMHGIGALPHNSEVDVPLTYADYYFVEALMRFKTLLNE